LLTIDVAVLLAVIVVRRLRRMGQLASGVTRASR
jgi:hypothetical protein